MFYGACGNEGCASCWPLFDRDNHEILDTDNIEGVTRFLLGGK
jgi:hypothetical protein